MGLESDLEIWSMVCPPSSVDSYMTASMEEAFRSNVITEQQALEYIGARIRSPRRLPPSVLSGGAVGSSSAAGGTGKMTGNGTQCHMLCLYGKNTYRGNKKKCLGSVVRISTLTACIWPGSINI